MSDIAAERAGKLALRLSEAEQRVAQLEAALARWREKYQLEDDGRRFVSIPVEVFDQYLKG